MHSIYTKGPSNVPEDLTRPTKSFKKHVWLSVIGLLLFIILYFILTIWFGRLAYNLFLGKGEWTNYLLAGGFAFLSLFMAKSLFIFTKRQKDPMRRYLNQKDEPVLFDYLYKLADEAGAPRPHKVFLTDRVNASVSYDLSILNLFFPSKKNLEIGLGLVNVLSLGELKAVLAHEFGHFAQRSMLLGRYVYVAQQIAAQIVNKRDIFDKFLSGLSGVDLRIAWIGWILSILVWAIRSLIETCFSVVAIAERALSREMEFQADLVAVSLTGSDALMHALYKLQIADEAYSNAIEVINSELNNKKAVNNMYTLQTNYIEKMAIVLKDPNYGKSPKVQESQPELNRIFASRTYNPPQMWSTHPADRDREENAKKIYIAADIDNRSSEDLLSDPRQFEIDMTAALIATAKIETTLLTDEEGIALQNKKYFNWTFLHPKYNSTFLNRLPFTNFETVDEIYDINLDSRNLKEELERLYPETLATQIDQLKEINEEIEALIISKNEVVTAEKRIITHRGKQIKRRDIPEILEALHAEEHALRSTLATHDKRCRKVHYAAAEKLEKGWSAYLKSLTSLVHYAEHAIRNLHDVSGKYNNVVIVALADGHVSSSELMGILAAARDYYYAVRKIYNNSDKIELNSRLLEKLDIKSYAEAYEKFTLSAPDKETINEWMGVISGWANNALDILDKLRNVALEELLDTEDRVQQACLNDQPIQDEAPKAIIHLEKYDTLIPGKERPVERKLNFWNRFFIGDGLFPSTARFGISAAMILGTLFLGSYSQKSVLHMYNGLGTAVRVEINEEMLELDPNSYLKFPVNYGSNYSIVTSTSEGTIIEQLTTDFQDPSQEYVYNIANAGAFVEYPIFYGFSRDVTGQDTYVGAKKWFATSADYVLEEPPQSISLSSTSSGEQRDALMGYSAIEPGNLLAVIENSEEAQKMIRAHVQWDTPDSKNLLKWMDQLYLVENKVDIITKRLERFENEVSSLRALQNVTDSIQRIKVCEDVTKRSKAQPENSDLYYLACRCLEEGDMQDEAFIKGYKKWRDNTWLAFAAAYTYAGKGAWEEAYEAFKIPAKNEALAERIGLDAERVRRFIAAQHPSSNAYSDYIIPSTEVTYYNDLERGNLENLSQDPNNAYYLMSQGKLTEAFTFIKDYENYAPYLIRLLAASENAPQELIEAGLQLSSDAGINYNTVWSALGLAIRENVDSSPYIKTIEELGLDTAKVEEFCTLVKASRFDQATQVIADQNFELKAHLYVLANTLLNNGAPRTWKDYINSILFIDQHPFST